MLYVRISWMKARAGKEHEVASVMDDLVDFYMKQHGYKIGYKLTSADETGQIGRITVWETEESADAAAMTNHVMARRSELLPIIEDGSHEERSFWAEEESRPLTTLLQRITRRG